MKLQGQLLCALIISVPAMKPSFDYQILKLENSPLQVLTVEFIPFILIFGCNYILSLVQSKWLGIYRRQWWNNMRMWMIVILTSDVVATFEVLLNLLGLKEETFLISPNLPAEIAHE